MKALYGLSIFCVFGSIGNFFKGNELNAAFFAILSGMLYLSFKAEEWKKIKLKQ